MGALKIFNKTGEVNYTINKFPDGQVQFCIDLNQDLDDLLILTSLANPTDLDILRQVAYFDELLGANLVVTYLYGARCDKITDGKVSVVPVAFETINMVYRLGFKRTRFFAPHCINPSPMLNWFIFPQPEHLGVDINSYDRVAYPDRSASARWLHLAPRPNLTANKVRDQVTGNIIKYELDPEVIEQIKDEDSFLIADDLCDGGRTFRELAQLIPDKYKDLLIVHGVFSNNAIKGLFDAGIRDIYVTNSFDPTLKPGVFLGDHRLWVTDVWNREFWYDTLQEF